MKTAKLIIGIISIVLFMVISFQSCAAGFLEAIEGEGASGGAGMFLAFAMLVAGIVGIVSRSSKGGGITSAIFYIIAALIGFTNLGVFADLIIWSALSLIFGAVFLIGSVKM